MQYIMYTLLYIKWWTVSFCCYFCVLIWTCITVPGVYFIILFTNFLAIYGDSTHNINEECYGECTILPSSPNGGKFYFMSINSFYGFICTTFLTHWAWILCAEKLSGSNAFCSRTVRGLDHNPCFNGIWQEFCQTSPSAGQKRRECGNKHPTGGSVPLIHSINKRWFVRNWWWKDTPQQVLMWGLWHSCDHPWVFQLPLRIIFLTLTLIFRHIHFSAGVNRSMRIRSLYKLL